ncbi:hypothetical protein [Burkholderia seminalis]|uniref:hypothetical protein n=1 Tax=Burkholderia seminalis TaxID=488731 RepID=UPI001588B58D|nr:hypothetical protein [Burkholderia seminalis]
MRTQLLVFGWVVSCTIWASAAYADGDPSVGCFSALSDNPAIGAIQGKVVTKIGGHPDLSMLSNDRRPTKKEKDALSAWVTEGERCYELGRDFRATNYPPVVSALIDESLHALEALVAKLYSGKLTYAQFNEQRQASDDQYRARIAGAVQELRAQQSRDQAEQESQRRTAEAQEAVAQAQREATEEARQQERRALALRMLSNMKPAYVSPPPPMPTQHIQNTNCSAFGNQMNCTTSGY